MSIKTMLKVCSAAAFLLLIYAALGPEKWIPRSGFGWRVDHFFGYFALTSMFCFIWGRPFLFGGALMAAAVLFEGLRAFTPDRHADFYAALISASGAMTAILPADFFIRAPKQPTGRSSLRLIAEEWDVPNIGARGSGPQGNAARPQFSLRLRLLKAVPATGE